MQCNEFLNYSGEWMEGGRAPAAADHWKTCANCRGLIADMESISQAAGAMDAETPAPPARVWLAVRAQLESEGIIRQPGFGDWFAGFFAALPRPALAGAYVAVLLAALVLGSVSLTPVQEATSPDLQLQSQFTQVEQQQMIGLPAHDPAVTATYRDSLAVVDKFIAMCEKTVREDPKNEIAREYLYAAFQQKAELLASMTERGSGGE